MKKSASSCRTLSFAHRNAFFQSWEKKIEKVPVLGSGLSVILFLSCALSVAQAYDLSVSNGPAVGGNSVVLTNATPDIGDGSDITNVTVCSIAASVDGQGANWVQITLGAGPVNGTNGDIVVQSTSIGDTTFTNVYTYNPTGVIPAPSRLPRSIILTNSWLDGTNGIILAGAAPNDQISRAVSSAGDVNGDGIDDVLIGAYQADPSGRSAAGETYLVFGCTNGFPALISLTNTWLNGTNGVLMAGAAASDNSGYSVSSAGDVNGDGLDDLMVGAYLADPSGLSSAGETYLVYGRTNGFPALITLTNTWLNGTNGVILEGGVGGCRSGCSVSSAGDVNGDGLDDLLVGAYLADPFGFSNAGETYLLYGCSTGFSSSVILGSTWLNGTNGVVFNGAKPMGQCGSSVSSAGDVNGDGLADMLISAYNVGETYLVYGRTNSFPAMTTLTNTWLDGTNGIILAGATLAISCGYSVSSAGDVNGDGLSDMLIGAYQANPSGLFSAGETYLVYGRTNGFPALITLTNTWLDGTNGIILEGVKAGDNTGRAVSSAGDVNGDGLADILIGAYVAGSASQGESYLIYGSTNGLPSTIPLSAAFLDGTNGVFLTGADSGDRNGYSVGLAGDVNNDGLDDILSASYLAGTQSQGEVYLVYGVRIYTPVIPIYGSWTGGYQVTISGTNLCNSVDVTNVTLCGVDVLSIDNQSQHEIIVTAGLSPTSGIGDVRVYSTSYGETVLSNGFNYLESQFVLLGTNGMVIADNEAASLVKGTRFRPTAPHVTLTNTFSITNAGTEMLTITSWTTNGAGASNFEIQNMPLQIPVGEVGDFVVTYTSSALGSNSATFVLNCNEHDSPFNMNVDGTCNADVLPLSGPYCGGNTLVITNHTVGNGSDITNVTVCGIQATVVDQDTDWVVVTLGAGSVVGIRGDIVIQSTSLGETTLADAYTYNPAGEVGMIIYDWTQWEEVAGLPEARQSLAAARLNDAIYALGGYNGSYATNVYRYDGTNWTEVVGLPVALSELAVEEFNGSLYAIGGYDGSCKTNVYRYNGTNWAEVAGLEWGISRLAGGVLNSSLYAIGGWLCDFGMESDFVYQYDGMSWSAATSLPDIRGGLAVSELNGYLYAIGGESHWFPSGAFTNVYRFDGTNWVDVAGLPLTRYNLAAATLNNSIFVIGGVGSTNVYRFDGTNWMESIGLPAVQESLAASVLHGSVYAIGGSDGSTLTNVYRYPGQTSFSGLTPAYGSWTGGYQVVIAGMNLCNGNLSDVTNVILCGTSVDAIDSVTDSTQIVVTAAAGTPGLGDVVVHSVEYGMSVRSNVFTYMASSPAVIGTNGAVIASDDAASVANGTDFGHVLASAVWTNTFSITNGGDTALTISGWTTNGSGAVAFDISNLPSEITEGTVSNFNVVFTSSNSGSFSATLNIANDSPISPYIVNLSGSAYVLSKSVGPYSGGNTITITNGTLGNGMDITNVNVGGSSATITDQGVNWVTITLPVGSAGAKDIIIQSTSAGDVELTGAYTYNPAGGIGWHLVGPYVWTNLGSGVDDTVRALVVGENGDLYVGGAFTNAGGIVANRIAKWDSASEVWTNLDSGMDDTVYALVLKTNGNLCAGGAFDVAGDVLTDSIAEWDGVTENWTNFGIGIFYEVYALAIGTNNEVFAGKAASINDFYVEKWDPVSENWTGLELYGLGTTVYTLAIDSNATVYAGGKFSGVGYSAKWDASEESWVSLGSGLNIWVHSMVSSTNDKLYVGGVFTTAGGVSALRVAQWDIVNEVWTNLGLGVGPIVWSLALGQNNDLYAGGTFTTAGGVDASKIAKWDIVDQSWTNLGAGIDTNGTVYALATGTNGELYAGGTFSSAGSVGAANIAKWAPAYIDDEFGIIPVSGSWVGGHQVVIKGTNLCNGNLSDVTNVTLCGASVASIDSVAGSTQVVITAGVGMPGLGDVRVYSVDYGMSVRSNGFTYTVSDLVVLGTNGGWIVSDETASVAKGSDFGYVISGAVWTNTFSITNSNPSAVAITAVATNGSGAGGFNILDIPSEIVANSISNFTVVFNPTTLGNYTATLAITNDSALSPYLVNLAGLAYELSVYDGPSAGGNSLVITNGILGDGVDITNVTVCGIAATIIDQGVNWVEITLGVGPTDGISGDVIIQSTSEGVTTFENAYTYNPSGWIGVWSALLWTNLASGVSDQLNALAVDSGNNLYAGGFFTTAGGQSANAVAQWDGIVWTNLGSGADNTVWALSVGMDDTLYAGGQFTTVGGVGANAVARWDGSIWTNLSSGVDFEVRALHVSTNNNLYAGGWFTSAGGISANCIARWDGAAWTNMGSGMSDYVLALSEDQAGNLYAGGWFETAGGVTANCVAVWTGGGWTNLDVGMNDYVYALTTDTNGWLYAGGAFTNAGGNAANYVARWDGSAWTNLGAGLDSEVHALYMDTNGVLFAGGSFTNADSLEVNYIAQWDPVVSAWTNLSSGMSNTVLALAKDRGDNLYAGGAFTNADGLVANRVAEWGRAALSGVSPISGSVTGGYPVTIVGRYLGNGADVTNVTLNGVAAASIDSQSQTQVVITVGSVTAAGVGDVVVYSTSYGITTSSNAFTYTREPQAALVFSPTTPQAYLTTNALSVSGGSGTGVVSYAVLSGPGQIVDGTNLTVTGGIGSIDVTVTKAQDDLYYEATVTATVTAAKAGQTITFAPIPNQYTSNAVGLAATASSELAVNFAVGIGPGSIAGGTNLTFSGVGAVSIVASQAGDANWAIAPDVTNTFSVYELSTQIGPSAGGNTIIVTNGTLGDGIDITNVTVCGIAATIVDQGVNWVEITLGAGPVGGTNGDVVVQSNSEGDTTFANAYIYNPAGQIGEVGNTWTNLGVGMDNGSVAALVVDASNKLYAAGSFTQSGGTSLNYIAEWNTESGIWSNLGVGVSAGVMTLDVDESNDLYAGGSFFMVGGVTSQFVAIWHPQTESWIGFGTGILSQVQSIVVDGTGGFYVGGYFTTAGGLSANRIAHWDGSAWTNLGEGVNNFVDCLALDGEGQLYVGGVFSIAGGRSANRIAKWNPATEGWTNLGSGMNGRVYALAVDDSGDLYAGGQFTTAGGLSARYIAKWDAATEVWTNLGSGMSFWVYSLGLDKQGRLYAGGVYTNAGGVSAKNIARWDPATQMWTNLGSGLNSAVSALAFDSEDHLYAGGFFTNAGGMSANRVAMWSSEGDSGVVPAFGVVTGGYTVVISGSNLGDGSDVTNVTLCGASVRSIESQSATQIVVVAEGGLVGLGDVRVYSSSFGESVRFNAFNYLRMSQAALVFNPTTPQTYLTTNALSVSGGSGTGVVSYVVLSGPGQIIDNTNLSVTGGAGNIELTATKAQDDLYYEATVTATVAAAKASQTITFDPIADQYISNAIGLAATASSGLSVSFAVGSGPGAIASGTNLTFTGVGEVGVVASQTGDADWDVAPDVTNTLSVYDISVQVGPSSGGNTIIITNGMLGNGIDITNVTVCGVNVAIVDQGVNWVEITLSVGPSGGTNGDIIVQSTSAGDTTFVNAYTYNPAGFIPARSTRLTSDIKLDNVWLDGTNGVIMEGAVADIQTGWAVSTAGDFNGDGYEDFLTSSYMADPLGWDGAGETYLIFGTPDGYPSSFMLTNTWLNGTNGVTLAGRTPSINSGIAVSSAGDVNGDGLSDLLIGAYNASPDGRTQAGESYLVFGRTNGCPPTIVLNQFWLDGTNGVLIEGSVALGNSGYAVNTAGDVNGDGLSDFLIGASRAESGGKPDAGETYLIYGRTNEYPAMIVLTNTWLDGVNGSIFQGAWSPTECGDTVSSAGDVNGDGYSDFLIGAYLARSSEGDFVGQSYLIYGRSGGYPSAVVLTNTWLNGTNGVIFEGAGSEQHYFGKKVSMAGDINGDGLSDFIVSETSAEPLGITGAGACYLIYGRTNAFAPLVIVTNTWIDGTNGFAMVGARSGYHLGKVASSAGDVNGDGLSDILVGTIYGRPHDIGGAGVTYLVYGCTNVFDPMIVMTNTWLDGTNGVMLSGASANDYSGRAVSSAGDVNGDGWSDFLVSATGADPGGRNVAGETYLIYGRCDCAPVVPYEGSWTGGYQVVINGTNLCNGNLSDITNVALCGVNVMSIDSAAGSTQVVVTADTALAAGIGDVVVYSVDYGMTIASNAFVYLRELQTALVFSPTTPQTYLTTNALSTSGGSGTGVVSYAVLSGPGQIVDSTNLVVTGGAGIIELTATKAQDDLYYETTVTATVTAAKADQTILFPVISNQVQTNTVGLSATADSGLSVGFSVGSGPAVIASGTNLSFTGGGDVSILASQGGDSNWNVAPSVTNRFHVYGFYTLTITSEYGTVFLPNLGTYTNLEGTVLTNYASTPVDVGYTQYVNNGWTLLDHDPSSGTGFVAVFAQTNNTVLTWQWTTNYWLISTSGPNGSVSVMSDWYASGTSIVISALSAQYYHFTNWSGDVSGAMMYLNPITVTVGIPSSVTAHFSENVTANTRTPEWWLAAYGFTNHFDEAATNDIDGDKMLTWQEYIGDTSPTNADSFLRVEDISLSGGRLIRWAGGTASVQYLERTTNLLDETTWEVVDTNLPPTAVTNETSVSEDVPEGMYRIRVTR